MVDDREGGEVVVVWLGVLRRGTYQPMIGTRLAACQGRYFAISTWLPVENSLGLAAFPRMSNAGARCQGSWGPLGFWPVCTDHHTSDLFP